MALTSKILHGLIVLGLLAASFLLAASVRAAPVDQDGDQGWIAYIGNDGNVWLVHPDGSGVKQLTTDVNEGQPYSYLKWSPGGRRLAFIKYEDQGSDVFIYDPEQGQRIGKIVVGDVDCTQYQ